MKFVKYTVTLYKQYHKFVLFTSCIIYFDVYIIVKLLHDFQSCTFIAILM